MQGERLCLLPTVRGRPRRTCHSSSVSALAPGGAGAPARMPTLRSAVGRRHTLPSQHQDAEALPPAQEPEEVGRDTALARRPPARAPGRRGTAGARAACSVLAQPAPPTRAGSG